jgi:hypothetical protein
LQEVRKPDSVSNRSSIFAPSLYLAKQAQTVRSWVSAGWDCPLHPFSVNFLGLLGERSSLLLSENVDASSVFFKFPQRNTSVISVGSYLPSPCFMQSGLSSLAAIITVKAISRLPVEVDFTIF